MSKTPARASAKSWLKAAVKRIVAKARPDKVVLFGSRAYGLHMGDSFLRTVLRRGKVLYES